MANHEPTMLTFEVKAAPVEKKARILLIGAGNIASTHLQAYAKIPEAEIVAACDIDETRLNLTCDAFGIKKRYTDLDTMLKEEAKNADAADVCVWNCSHAKCAIAAMKAGLHVFSEKPMAYNTEQAMEMKKVSEETGKLLMIGFVLRFSDEHNVAMDFINNNNVGNIYYAKATYLRKHGAPGGWFTDYARSGGGPVIDLGVHVIDSCRVLMGSPKPVSVFAATYDLLKNRPHLATDVGWKPYSASADDIYDVEDFGTALIRFDNGATMLLETSYSLNGEDCSKRELFGDKGGMVISNGVKIYTEINNYLVNFTPDTANLRNSKDAFHSEMAHFVDCVLNGTPCRATADDGIWVMKILDAVYESAKTGHEVIIK